MSQSIRAITNGQSHPSLQVPLVHYNLPVLLQLASPLLASKSHYNLLYRHSLSVPSHPAGTTTTCQYHYSLPESHLCLQAPLQPASTITNCDILAGCNVTWRQDVTPKSASPILASKSHFNLSVPSQPVSPIATCHSHHL